jgi:hypothetical protein
MIDLTGYWEGVIILGPQYGDKASMELFFSIEIKQEDESFTGIAKDIKGIGCNPDVAMVKGFVDENNISFTKEYLSTVIIDENGNEILQKGVLSPEISYTGVYDAASGSCEGEWEMYINSIKTTTGWIEDLLGGTWKMTRKK